MKTKVKKTDIWNDPIVEEVRKAGEEMAREAGYNLHKLCERLRKSERRHPERYSSSQHLERAESVH
jgi:hypothetical protein